MHGKFLKRVFTNANIRAIIMPTRRTKGEKPMAKTIKDILGGFVFESTQLVDFSDNGLSGAKLEVYPYKFVRNGIGNTVDKNIFILDMVDVRKFMSYQKNNKDTFYEKMINNVDAYKDEPGLMEENREELYLAWWAMCDQLKTMVEDIKDGGGIVAVPNVTYFKNALNTYPVNYTNIRRELATVLEECLVHNYREAERINATRLEESQKIKPSDDYKAYLQRISERNAQKGNNGRDGKK